MLQYDIENIAKIVAIIVGGVTTWNIAFNLLKYKHTKLREEYKFARDFFSDLEGIAKNNEYLKQKGFDALTGNLTLPSEEVQYIISLNEPAVMLRAYSLGKPYLQFSTLSENKIKFKPRWKNKTSRTLMKIFYSALYAIFYLIAFGPLILNNFKLWGHTSPIPTFIFTAVTFFPAAYFSVKAGVKISLAEKVIKGQQRP